jgi:hypothetical protein
MRVKFPASFSRILKLDRKALIAAPFTLLKWVAKLQIKSVVPVFTDRNICTNHHFFIIDLVNHACPQGGE